MDVAGIRQACFPRGPLTWRDPYAGRHTLFEQYGDRVVIAAGLDPRNRPVLMVCDERGILVPLTPGHPVAQLLAGVLDYRTGMAEALVLAEQHGAQLPPALTTWAHDVAGRSASGGGMESAVESLRRAGEVRS